MTIKVDSKSFIVFDLDDTLYSEIDFLTSAYREIVCTLNPGDKDLIINEMCSLYNRGGNPFEYLIQRLPKHNLTIEKLLSLYRNHLPDIPLRPGALDLLKMIKVKGGKIGIITNGRSITQRNKIKSLKISPYIDELVISEERGFAKPDENIYALISEKYPSHTFYYFGDNNEIDFLAPKKLKWYCVGLKDYRNIHKTKEISNEAYLPHEFINSFTEVIIR